MKQIKATNMEDEVENEEARWQPVCRYGMSAPSFRYIYTVASVRSNRRDGGIKAPGPTVEKNRELRYRCTVHTCQEGFNKRTDRKNAGLQYFCIIFPANLGGIQFYL